MKPIKVFKVLARRRIIIVCLVFVLVLGIGIGLGANLLQKAKKAKAVTFLANSDSLVIPENSIVYIGAGGYISQKFYTQTAESYNPAHFISSAGLTMPADRIWQTNYNGCSSVPTPTVWADTSYSNGCYSFISDGAGMILKYNKSIDIYGTVVIGDRVVFDAPNITLHSGSKIFANGQTSQLGFADSCGSAGIGGQNGGYNGSSLDGWQPGGIPADLYVLHCNDNQPGGGAPADVSVGGLSYSLQSASTPVTNYFTVNGAQILGGRGQNGGKAFQGSKFGGSAGSGILGIGGGGGAGATGNSTSLDHGNASGAGGGFGLVFQSSQLNVFSNAEVNAKGGDSALSANKDAQTPGHVLTATGGLGGPGGGGVIIVNSLAVNFFSNETTPVAAPTNFNLFAVNSGVFDPVSIDPTFDNSLAPGYSITTGAINKAADGKLILNIGNGIISVKKTLVNITAGASGRPNYVFRSGDTVQITLDVSNLTIDQPVTIADDIFSDSKNLATVDQNSISDRLYGKLAGPQVVWSFSANVIKTSGKTLTYTLTVN